MGKQLLITYLVGNGFDMALKLKTSAKDIVDSFVEKNKFTSEKKRLTPAEKLAKEISDEGVENWADFEMKLGAWSLRFQDKSYGSKKDYLEGYEAFILHLHNELEAEYAKYCENGLAKSNAQKCVASLKGIPETLPPGERKAVKDLRKGRESESWTYDVVTLNYTKTIDDMIQHVKTSGSNIGDVDGNGRKHIVGEVIHAHETLDGLVICGLDCPEQILYEKFREDEEICQTLVKDYAQRYSASDSDTLSFDKISKSDVICIFGTSLGFSDGRWWRAVLERLVEEANALAIIYSYALSKEAEHTTTGYRRKREQELLNLAEAAGESCQVNFDDVKSRIFVTSSNRVFPLSNTMDDFSEG